MVKVSLVTESVIPPPSAFALASDEVLKNQTDNSLNQSRKQNKHCDVR
jgi:hypothetical protein